MTRDEVKEWLRRGRDLRYQYITMDTSSKCTLQCPVCRRQSNKIKGIGPPGEYGKDMPISDFLKINKYFEVFSFCGAVSDPILYENLIEALSIIYKTQENPHVWVHTAATAKHKDKAWYEKAFSANPNAIWIFALDGLPETSHKYRVGQDGPFLFEMMKLGVSMGIKVEWQYIVFKYNENDIDIARKMAKEHGMHFELKITNRYEQGQKPLNPKWHVNEIF